MTQYRRPQGFTLVELLVVIGIIAILIAILLPALSKVQQSARSMQCQSNLRQMAIYGRMYAMDWEWLPVQHTPGTLATDDRVYQQPGAGRWFERFEAYKNNEANRTIFFCPEAELTLEPARIGTIGTGTNYGLNKWRGGQRRAGTLYGPGKPSQIHLNTKTYWFADASVRARTNGLRIAQILDPNWPGGAEGPWSWNRIIDGEMGGPDLPPLRGHPGGKANFVFGDGHVEAITFEEFKSWGAERAQEFRGYRNDTY